MAFMLNDDDIGRKQIRALFCGKRALVKLRVKFLPKRCAEKPECLVNFSFDAA